jgi:hypothetical protein
MQTPVYAIDILNPAFVNLTTDDKISKSFIDSQGLSMILNHLTGPSSKSLSSKIPSMRVSLYSSLLNIIVGGGQTLVESHSDELRKLFFMSTLESEDTVLRVDSNLKGLCWFSNNNDIDIIFRWFYRQPNANNACLYCCITLY